MKILIIGDLNENMVKAAKMAKEKNVKVLHALDINPAMDTLRNKGNVDLIFIDVKNDISLLKQALDQELFPTPIISCGITDDQNRVVKSIEDGAIEYLPLPPNKELITELFDAIVKNSQNNDIIYKSKEFGKIVDLAKKIAPSIANVLISGESGTGKEVIANFVHANSDRSKNDLISINCAAIPENLLESEMFGHEKGSFTGALERKIGKFEQAHKGTLFLDEISEMDLKLQAKLLRSIQEREIYRVGGNNPIKLDVRIIATSNRDLLSEIKKGTFREDLFYRLNVIHLKLPKLSERTEDIPLLANHFIKKYCKLNGLDLKSLDEPSYSKLNEHHWSGNVRELENAMHRAVLISPDDKITIDSIELEDMEQKIETLGEIEKKAINRALIKFNRDKELVAKVLGVSIKILEKKLKLHFGD